MIKNDEDCDDHNIGEEEDDDDDDEELYRMIREGKLPANTATTLAVNQAYQELVHAFITKLEKARAALHNEMNINSQLLAEFPDDQPLELAWKVPAQLYIHPYFHDTSSMCPPPNEEQMRKCELQNFDMLVEQPRKWSKREETKLIESMNNFAFQKLITPLNNTKDIFAEKLEKSIQNEGEHSSAAKKFQEQIKDVENKIRKLTLERERDTLKLDDFEGIDWIQMAFVTLNGSRTAEECRLAWKNAYHPSINQKVWSKNELKMLKHLVEDTPKEEKLTFVEIAEKLGTKRTPFQCAEKYQTELNNDLIRSKWTEAEDSKLQEAIDKCRLGDFVPWQQVASFLNGRTRLQCQVRWTRTLNPQLKHGRWTKEEDGKLLAAVKKYGCKDWCKIASLVDGRTDSQCRERWCASLKIDIKRGGWSSEEEAMLKHGVESFGTTHWSKIAAILPGRTPSSCKVHYRSMMRKIEKRVANGEQNSELNVKVEKVKRKRGRPPKSNENVAIAEDVAHVGIEICEMEEAKCALVKKLIAPKVEKKRGRPRLSNIYLKRFYKYFEEGDPHLQAEMPESRRGRPPGSKNKIKSEKKDNE